MFVGKSVRCPRCERPMRVALQVAPLGSQSGGDFFECERCQYVQMQSVSSSVDETLVQARRQSVRIPY
jgi:hypothetical protein